MNRIKSWRWVEKALLIGVLFLSILIIVTLFSRHSPTAVAQNDFLTVFVLTENASPAYSRYHIMSLVALSVLVVGIAGLAYVGVPLVFKRKTKRASYIIYSAALIFVGVAALNIVNNTDGYLVKDCARLQSLYDSQEYRLAEGAVHVLQSDRKRDKISVDGTVFDVDYFLETCGYKASVANGGILAEGVYAKVYYSNDRTILRIDVKNQ